MKRFAAAFVLLLLMITVSPSAEAASLAISFTGDADETMRVTVTGRTLRVVDVTDIEKYASFELWLDGEKDYTLTAQTSESRKRADISLADVEKGKYKVLLYYAAAESSKLKALLPPTVTLTVTDSMLQFEDSPTLASNVALKGKADSSDAAMRYYKWFSSDDEVKALAESLTASQTGAYLKARAVYDWVCANVYLDLDSLASAPAAVTASQVLGTKIAVSRGFAVLTAELLRAVGIPARIVKGVGAVLVPSMWNDNNPSNDAVEQYWVEAYTDGRWINIDTACGTMNTATGGRKTRLPFDARLYFDSTDAFFAYSHSATEYETAPLFYGTQSVSVPDMKNGTAKKASSLGLPEKITALTSVGNLLLDVKWDVDGCGYDPDKAEKQTFTVSGTYTLPQVFESVCELKQTAKVTLTVNARVLTSVKISSPAEQTVCFEGDELNTDGLKLLLGYDNGKTETVGDGFTAACDTATPGEKTVEIKYKDFTLSYDLRVLSRTPQSLELTSPMTKTSYYRGDSLDISGLKLKLCYEAGYKFDADEYTIEYDFSLPGERDVVFSCEGVSVSQTVNVEDVVAVSLSVATMPDKREFTLGSEPDFGGLTVTVKYNNGTERTVDDGLLFDYDATAAGEVEVTVSYSGVSALFTMTSLEPVPSEPEPSRAASDTSVGAEPGGQGANALTWVLVFVGAALLALGVYMIIRQFSKK